AEDGIGAWSVTEFRRVLFRSHRGLREAERLRLLHQRPRHRLFAIKHDREESMPWALMKQAQTLGLTQTAVIEGRKKLTGVDEDQIGRASCRERGWMEVGERSA